MQHKILLEPTWFDFTSRRRAGIPELAFYWLKDQGSLTRRLIDFCQGQFSVRLLHQSWGQPLNSEARLLGTRRAETAMVREVELLCDVQPLVFARTIIPATSMKGGARKLAQLGSKPLGAVLFADPSTQRTRIQVARISPRYPMYAAATDHLEHKPAELWGRRTLFLYAGKPILVNEIFLPGVMQASQAQAALGLAQK